MAGRRIDPTDRFHKSTGKAIVTYYASDGQRRSTLLPGPFNSDESRKAYKRILAIVKAGGDLQPQAEQRAPNLTIDELILSNDGAILKSVGGQLLPTLMKSKDRKQQIEESVWTVLSRAPTSDDYDLFDSYLEKRKDRPAAGLQQMIWALINSPEFRFNH